jgi:chromosome segregation ATPase
MQAEVQETRTKLSEITIRIRDLQEDEQILNEKNQTMEKKLTELRKEISQKNQELREVEVLIQDTKESKSPKEEYRQNRAITDPRTTEERNALKHAKQEKEAILNEILAFQEQLNQIQWQRELLNRVSHLKGVYDAKDLYVSSHEEHETLINSYKTQIQNLEKEKRTYAQRDEQYMKTISDIQAKVDKLVEIHQKTPEVIQPEDRNLLEEIQLKDQKIQELTAQYGVSYAFTR